MYFTEQHKVVIAVTTAAGASGTDPILSAAIDMAGFNGCCFLVPLGPITTNAVTSLKVQQSSDDGATDAYSDVAGTAVTIADSDDNTLKFVDVIRPGKRYLKLSIARGTQVATIGSVLAIQYQAGTLPVTQGAGVVGEQHTSPAEGTA